MVVFARIAEERIRQAQKEGAFDGLAGAGRPLVFEDDRMVPEDLRMAYRVLRNSGFTPPEVTLHKEIIGLRDLISTLDDDAERLRRIRELNFKVMKFNMTTGRTLTLDAFPEYEERLYAR